MEKLANTLISIENGELNHKELVSILVLINSELNIKLI